MHTKVKVLLFDDDVDVLELCSHVLARKGYEVFAETDCGDLIQKVATIRPDVIFMDHWIDGGGIAATRRLKEHGIFNTIPIIYFSANDEVEHLARKAGADTYFAKPFDIHHLEDVITETLRKKNAHNLFLKQGEKNPGAFL
jgi:two-component system cell cycle response regulator DivK